MELIMGRLNDPELDQTTYFDMLRFRYRIFKEKLAWDVQGADGMEFDIYDTLNPYYMIAKRDTAVTGCWRLLPTTGPYMLKNTFNHLLQGQPAPSGEHIWEVSRFAVDVPGATATEQAGFNWVTLEMFRRAVVFAVQKGIKQFVSVNSLAFEKVMDRAGIRSRRFENTEPQRIGKVSTVACWIDINDQLLRNLFLTSVVNQQQDTGTKLIA
ncbi:MAG: GNAT family N-acetyltransferase [Gammaproteobacteria bacterium]|nr:GNAT family N-acetyltransferase [Gammaproteobacteria bacterium]